MKFEKKSIKEQLNDRSEVSYGVYPVAHSLTGSYVSSGQATRPEGMTLRMTEGSVCLGDVSPNSPLKTTFFYKPEGPWPKSHLNTDILIIISYGI